MKPFPTVEESEIVIEELIEKIGIEAFAELQYGTHLYRILTAIYRCGTINEDDIINDIFTGFEKVIPEVHIQSIVHMILPHLLTLDNLIINNKLTPDGLRIAIEQQTLMHLDKKPIAHNKYLN